MKATPIYRLLIHKKPELIKEIMSPERLQSLFSPEQLSKIIDLNQKIREDLELKRRKVQWMNFSSPFNRYSTDFCKYSEPYSYVVLKSTAYTFSLITFYPSGFFIKQLM